MKIKHLILALLLLCSLTNYSQISKKNWMLGGSASIDYGDITQLRQNDSDYNFFRLNLEPNIGYFIVDKLAIGTSVDFFREQSKNEYYKETRKNTKFGPFIRYYLLNEENFTNVFLETSYLIEFGNKSKINNKTINAKIGTAIFLTNDVAFEILVKYAHFETNYDYDVITDNKGNLLSIGFGFQIHLERKR